MGIYNKNIRNNNGISYSKEVDGPSDWINIESETYFKDLSDSLIYYKNSNDIVISIFEEAGITSADNGLNISTSDDIELGGTLNKDTDINGNNKTLNLGTLTDALNGININSITSTRTHTFPGFDSITSEYTPGNLTINSVSLSGTQTHQNTTTPLQYRREISDTSTNVTSYINLQDQLTFSSENTSTSQSSNLLFATNQTSLSHSSGSGTSNVFTQTDLQTSLYYSGSTQNGITITGDTLNLYGPETNIDLNISGSIFTDNRVSGSTKGLEYGDDYHLGFTDRTLVDKAYVDNSIVNNITSIAGSGLTYDVTNNKINLGGVLDFNDPGNPSNNMYFIPSTGSNIIRWGADSLGNLPVNSGGSAEYIARFDYVSFQGEHKIFGASGHLGVNIGVYEGQTGNSYIKQYKDVSQITIQSTPGVNSSMTFLESDSPNIWNRTIWESHDSNTRSYTKQTFDEFEWNVYNNVGGDNATSKTYLHIESERIIAGVAKSDGTKFGIFQFAPTHIQFVDGDFKGVGTFPTSTYLGNLAGSNLIIEDSTDSTFTDGTSNKRGIKYIGFGETDTETGIDADYTTLVGTSLVPKKYVDDSILDINTIYNNDDSLTDDRIVYLDNNSLTFNADTSTETSPINFEFGGSWGGYTRWSNTGSVQIKSNSDTDPLTVYTKVNGSNFVSKHGGGGHLGGGWTLNSTYGGTSTRIELDNTSIKQYHGSGLQHRNQLGGASTGVHFFQAGIPGSLGYFIVGGNTRIGNEKISLQEDTLISGKLELSTITDGILLPRLDTSQMNGILSPDTHLVIFNTTLNALYRYNGTAWVAMSAGYGLIEVKDSAGNPTFYAVFKDAFDSIGGNGVITLHSDILVDDASEESVLVINNTLTINGNGYTITHTCNTGDDFAFINSVSASSKIYLNNVKIISNGTAGGSGSYVATLFGGISSSPSLIQCSEDTYIEATNNNICELTTIRGGTLVATNGKVCFSGAVENAKVTTKTTRSDFRNCHIQILTGGEMTQIANEIIGNIIEGDAVSNNLITLDSGLKFWDNTVICSSGSNNCIEMDSGSPASYINIQNCKVYNYGSGVGIKSTYIHAMKDLYVYSNGEGIYTQNTFTNLVSEYNMENVTIVTNSTNKNAFNRVDGINDFKMKNVIANNINSSNTEEAMNIRVSAGLTLYMEDCVANVANPVVDNLRLSNNNITTGGAYIYGLKMSKIGTGLNLNTVPFLNINTPDAYGNLKIG